MKLYAKIDSHGIRMSWDNIKDSFDEEGNRIDYQSPFHTKDDGWYEIPREPDFTIGEYLEYNAETDSIEIKQREKTSKEITREEFRTLYPIEKIIELQDAAIQVCGMGKDLPQEYQDYITFKEGIHGRIK